ncbi:MAG TPA: outer membrane beta-barrel protein [Vicinamibacteria bacterium]|nr:outer membrane beta-barrel protein [Vicinamibacteria bacterium]
MIAPAALAAVVVLTPRPAVQSIVLERDTARPTLTITASEPLPPPRAERSGERLTLVLDADLGAGTLPPPPRPPVKVVGVGPRDGHLVLELIVDPAVPHQVESDGRVVRVVFGAPPKAPTDVAALWVSLFPVVTEPQPLEAPLVPEAGSASADDSSEGLGVSRVRLRPSIEALYVSADSTFQTPQPTHDDYFELRPRLAALAPFGDGALSADYEGRWRRASRFPEVQEASHQVNGGLEVPVGPRIRLRVAEHFAVGTLETREVDPGGEYFFGLGRYRRNRFGVAGRLTAAGRFQGEAGAYWEALEVDDDAAFFDYDRRTIELRLGYELGPRMTAFLTGSHEEIPTPRERPLAQSSASTFGLELRGERGPLTTTEIVVDLRDQSTPLAAEGGRDFLGVVVGARVRRELGRQSMLQLAASRATFPSFFERNAYYVASAVGAELEAPVPLSLVLRLAAGYHWNDYRTPAAELDEPRRDRIWEGAIGLSRPLTRFAWVRADYRRERRDSNLDLFDATTYAFIVQAGVGFLGSPGR